MDSEGANRPILSCAAMQLQSRRYSRSSTACSPSTPNAAAGSPPTTRARAHRWSTSGLQTCPPRSRTVSRVAVCAQAGSCSRVATAQKMANVIWCPGSTPEYSWITLSGSPTAKESPQARAVLRRPALPDHHGIIAGRRGGADAHYIAGADQQGRHLRGSPARHGARRDRNGSSPQWPWPSGRPVTGSASACATARPVPVPRWRAASPWCRRWGDLHPDSLCCCGCARGPTNAGVGQEGRPADQG